MSMVYIIFAKDKKEYARTIEELKTHYKMPSTPEYTEKLCIHADSEVYLLHLVEKLQERIKERQIYKNPITLVYSPESFNLDIVTKQPHKDLLDLYNKHLKLNENFFTLDLKEFIKTETEVQEEIAQKRKELQNWFVGKMRGISQR